MGKGYEPVSGIWGTFWEEGETSQKKAVEKVSHFIYPSIYSSTHVLKRLYYLNPSSQTLQRFAKYKCIGRIYLPKIPYQRIQGRAIRWKTSK